MVSATSSLEALWFNGFDGVERRVLVTAGLGELNVRDEIAGDRSYALDTIRVYDRFAGLPRVVGLPDGGTLHVEVGESDDPFARWRRTPVTWLASRWWSSFVCAVLLVALVVWLDRVGIGLAAERVVRWVPQSIEERLGNLAMASADATWLNASDVDAARQEHVRERFFDLIEGHSRIVLDFRRLRGKDEGFNAFALPGDRIVILDGMVRGLTDDEIDWVLAHEIGHVVHRDPMREIARAFGLAALATTLWSDFSTWFASAGAALPMQAHSRDTERAADAYMRELGQRVHLSAEAQVSLWRKVRSVESEAGVSDIPEWLNTHPSTAERLAAAREQAQKQREASSPAR